MIEMVISYKDGLKAKKEIYANPMDNLINLKQLNDALQFKINAIFCFQRALSNLLEISFQRPEIRKTGYPMTKGTI